MTAGTTPERDAEGGGALGHDATPLEININGADTATAVHAVVFELERYRDDYLYVRARYRSDDRPDERSARRRLDVVATADGGAAARRFRTKKFGQYYDRGRDAIDQLGRQRRHGQQLRRHQRHRRSQAYPRRRPGRSARRPYVRHAHLGRSAQTAGQRDFARHRSQRHSATERRRRSGRDRPGADDGFATVPNPDQSQRPPADPRRVQADRGGGAAERRLFALGRRCRRGAGSAELRQRPDDTTAKRPSFWRSKANRPRTRFKFRRTFAPRWSG